MLKIQVSGGIGEGKVSTAFLLSRLLQERGVKVTLHPDILAEATADAADVAPPVEIHIEIEKQGKIL